MAQGQIGQAEKGPRGQPSHTDRYSRRVSTAPGFGKQDPVLLPYGGP